MDYQIKLFKNFKNGFSILETLIVLAVLILLTGISTSVYNSFKTHENLEITTLSLVEAIRHAQSNSVSGKGDSQWGVEVFANSALIFKGASYAGRDTSYDQVLDFSSGIIATGISEIIFDKLTGATVNTGTITLTNSYGAKNILINEKGTISYQ